MPGNELGELLRGFLKTLFCLLSDFFFLVFSFYKHLLYHLPESYRAIPGYYNIDLFFTA